MAGMMAMSVSLGGIPHDSLQKACHGAATVQPALRFTLPEVAVNMRGQQTDPNKPAKLDSSVAEHEDHWPFPSFILFLLISQIARKCSLPEDEKGRQKRRRRRRRRRKEVVGG
ncbi:hypothetical protein EYF80_005653 [Liparis tanakae]|uniref:Uncharacterized protein n=1 Tax=Liparis tanakae TaxID=230148 RepID=A0A4Z2J1Z8_9TELE|nr:hypothetical protein EYF80_005653 [Liparis tanakae]